MQECSLSLTLCCILCTFVSKFCCCPAEWQLVIRNLAQSLIQRAYPSVSGMQDVSLAQTLAFDVVNGECADSAHWRRPLVDDINYWMYKWRSWHLWQLNASCNWNTGAANCSNSTEHNHNKVWINCINTYLWLFFNLSGTDHVSNKLGEQILPCLPLLLLQAGCKKKSFSMPFCTRQYETTFPQLPFQLSAVSIFNKSWAAKQKQHQTQWSHQNRLHLLNANIIHWFNGVPPGHLCSTCYPAMVLYHMTYREETNCQIITLH